MGARSQGSESPAELAKRTGVFTSSLGGVILTPKNIIAFLDRSHSADQGCVKELQNLIKPEFWGEEK